MCVRRRFPATFPFKIDIGSGRRSKNPGRRARGVCAARPPPLLKNGYMAVSLVMKRPRFLMQAFSAVYFKNGPPFRAEDLPVGI
ncbi:hypothetical protein IE4872_CH00885 [Rhizobium gallicum]|uniref:Uncharacterized protein n=1 Tax=Rhizobium gallicum TaxID=56730 RepID=A0A1L5NFA3_9HYPH|nr:hypothetical protein IE4872_CH00885 [Rhizobium gallicum]